jgi:hypothetical protein
LSEKLWFKVLFIDLLLEKNIAEWLTDSAEQAVKIGSFIMR